MQRLTLTVPVNSFVPGDGFHAYSNADAIGVAGDEIDYARPITGRQPRAFWPLTPTDDEPPTLVYEGWLEGGWMQGNWLGSPETIGDVTVIAPALFFGWYLFAVKTFDAVGNVCPVKTPVTRRAFVNSGPTPPRRFKHSSTAGGRPVFSFRQSVQLAS